MTLTESEYERIKNIIYANTGIDLRNSKIDFLSRRVNARMEQLGLRSSRDYIRYLTLDKHGHELGELVNLVVIPETYFFRDYRQLKVFAEKVISLITEENLARDRLDISILSAGCSTGDEAYTLAIIVREMLDNYSSWRVRIDGIDISSRHIERAKSGIYSSRALRNTPIIYRQKYFKETGDSFEIAQEIRDMVNFKRANLFNERDMSELVSYDVVFCRNVLIYFSRDSARRVLEFLHDHMNRGGFIFLGSSESVGRITSLFTMMRLGDIFVYRKMGV